MGPIKIHSNDDWKKHFVTLLIFIIMVVDFICNRNSSSSTSRSNGSMK